MSLELLEPILAEVKVEEVQPAESPPEEQEEDELDFSAFDSFPFPAGPSSSRGRGGSALGSGSLPGGDSHRPPVRNYRAQSSTSRGVSRRHGGRAPSSSCSVPGRRNRLASLLGIDLMYSG